MNDSRSVRKKKKGDEQSNGNTERRTYKTKTEIKTNNGTGRQRQIERNTERWTNRKGLVESDIDDHKSLAVKKSNKKKVASQV